MKRFAYTIALLLSTVSMSMAEDLPKALTLEEAAKKIDQQVIVELEIKSASVNKGVAFLNSLVDHKDPKNFTIFVPRDVVEKFKEAKVDDVAKNFLNKKVRVTGTVSNFKEKLQIKIAAIDQIKIVDKKEKDKE